MAQGLSAGLAPCLGALGVTPEALQITGTVTNSIWGMWEASSPSQPREACSSGGQSNSTSRRGLALYVTDLGWVPSIP